MTYRVVVDTNLIISAFLWAGPPGNLIREIVAREIPLLTSPQMIAELDTKLRQHKFEARFQAQARTVEQVMDEYRLICKIVDPADVPENSVRDPKDEMILAAAVGGNASHLISGDKDLTTLARYGAVIILTPAQFLALLNPPAEPARDD